MPALCIFAEFSEEENSECQLTSVTVEKDYTPNGSLPSWTPKGSTGSLALVQSSTPGTPRSTCSNVSLLAGESTAESTERLAGAASPTKYPDVVEDAQSADSREFESPVSSPEHHRKEPDKLKERDKEGEEFIKDNTHLEIELGGRDSGVQSLETNSSSQSVHGEQSHSLGASQVQCASDIQVQVPGAGAEEAVQENHVTKGKSRG